MRGQKWTPNVELERKSADTEKIDPSNVAYVKEKIRFTTIKWVLDLKWKGLEI